MEKYVKQKFLFENEDLNFYEFSMNSLEKFYLIITTRSYAVFLNIFIYLDWIVNCYTMTLDSLKFLNPRISTPFLVKFPLLKYTPIHVLHSLR